MNTNAERVLLAICFWPAWFLPGLACVAAGFPVLAPFVAIAGIALMWWALG